MKYLLPALAMFALASPAIAGDEDKKEPAATEATDDSQNRMICKRQKSTGSRLRAEKVCMTAAQWAQLQRDQRMETERGQSTRWTTGG
jgi:hypothetical protein